MWELNLDWRHRNPEQHLVYLDPFPGHLVFDFCPFARSTDGAAEASVQPELNCSPPVSWRREWGRDPGAPPHRMAWVVTFCEEIFQSSARIVPRRVTGKHQCCCGRQRWELPCRIRCYNIGQAMADGTHGSGACLPGRNWQSLVGFPY